jgi:predicted molibdopterin-dependent oxidoreductase YjgC
VDNPRRLTAPLLRRGEELVEATWEEAIDAAAAGLREVIDSAGPEAVGVLGSARCSNEDNYVLARFARATLGTPNIDCSLRHQCVPESADGGTRLGPGTSTGQLSDLDDSDLILLVGSDVTEEHPAAAARVYRARQRGAKVVTISTRRHPLARLAEAHLPVRPGAEVRLLGSLLYVLLIEKGLARQEGEWAELRASVADLPPEDTAGETGVPTEAVRKAAEMYAGAQQVAIVYASGLTLSPHASEALQALASLAALASEGAQPRVVLLGLLSRNNLQGCRDMGVAPHHLPGYGELTGDAAAQRFEEAWGTSITRDTGLSAWQMPGRVQAMYIMGDDLVHSLPGAVGLREALSRLKFLVVHDLYMSDTASLADVVFPAAAFAEREGTTTSLERRVQHLRPAVSPPGQAREDWRIVAEVSRALGKPMPYQNSQQIFEEIAELLPIYAGVFYPPLQVNGGIRWPTPEAREAGNPSDVPEQLELGHPAPRPIGAGASAPETSEEHPILLAPDPTLHPWDGETTITRSLTAGVEFQVMERDSQGALLLVNPEDARRLGLRSGRPARVVSAKGETQMMIRVTEDVPQGVALMPYVQAIKCALFDVAAAPGTERPVLAPTPVSISSPE